MKKLMIVLSIIFTTTLLEAQHNDYPIGVYSGPREPNYVTLIDKIDNANFNMFGIRYNQIGESSFWDALDLADNMGMDLKISDNISVEEGGSHKATICNHFWYDAENSLGNDGLEHPECTDYWHYGLRDLPNNTGTDIPDTYAHGELLTARNAWKCSEDAGNSAGYAVEFLKRKLLDDYPLLKQITYWSGIDTLFFDFVMKFENSPSHPLNTEVCTLKVMVQDTNSTVNNYIPLTLKPVEGADYDSVLTVGNLIDNCIFPEYTHYQFYTELDSLPLTTKMGGARLYYLFFQIYWNGVGKLHIDGMQIEDNFYRKLKNGDYDEAITNRMDDFGGNDNINHFYSYDEPQPPHYEAFKKVKELLPPARTLATATTSSLWSGNNFQNLFEYLAEPELMMEDYYPVADSLIWNSNTLGYSFHIQSKIGNMFNYYKNVSAISSGAGIPRYAIIQSYGNWELEEDSQ